MSGGKEAVSQRETKDALSQQKEILRKQLELLETEEKNKEREQNQLDAYMRDVRLYGDTPKDPYAHQFKLLFHPPFEPTKRTELFDPNILLGNIKDSKSLYFFQRDFAVLHRFYDMGMRSEGVMDLFNNLYFSWVGQIRMTSALGGTERLLQSFFEPMQQSSESFSFWQKQKAKKENKRRLKDYLSMGGGGGGGGGGVYE